MRKVPTILTPLLVLAAASPLRAQTPTPTPTPSVSPTPTPTQPPNTVSTGQTWTTEGSRAVNGSRVAHTPDGSTWFLTPSNDQIVRLRDGVFTQWQIRSNDDIGANPVDFQIDGNDFWFIENGASLIDAGKSIVARLDTSTGQLREWVLPASRPAGFYRSPDGKIWVAQSAGVLESLDLTTLAVVDYQRVPTANFASTLAIGPDGGLWMTDFGNNRIVRHDMATSVQTSWTMFDPNAFRLNPSDMKFDAEGKLFITEFSGTRVDRFDPATGELRVYPGFTNPVHLDIFNGNVYVAQQTGANGKVTILDPRVAPYTFQILPGTTLPYLGDITTVPGGDTGIVSRVRPPAEVRDSVITPVTFNPVNDPIAAADLTVSSTTAGLLTLEFTKVNAYGIAAAGGAIWTGSNGNLVRLVPQTIGNAADQTLPVALQLGSPPSDPIRVDLTLTNRGTASITGQALFQYSAGAFPRARTFTVGPGESLLLEDAFVGASSARSIVVGSIRIQVTGGQAADLLASARSARYLPGGGSYGLALPAQTGAQAMGAGTTRTLFTGMRPGETSILGFYTPGGATATAELFAPDGTLRAARSLTLESNVSVEYNPASSFFGVSSAPGDVVRVTVTAGLLQPYVSIQDPVTRDVALSLPVAPATDAVIPNVGSVPSGSVLWMSGLQLSNSDGTRAASVTATYYPLGGGAPIAMGLTLPPASSASFSDVVAELFDAAPGQGAIVLTSDAPIAASQRLSAENVSDGSQFACQSAALDGGASIPDGGATALDAYGSSSRRTNLLLFNRGAAGTATVTAYNAAGSPVGQLLVPIGAGTAARVSRVFEAVGAPGTPFGRVLVEPSAGMRLYAQSVNVDPVTADTDLSSLR
jgi:streptogramin lyase